MTRSLRLLAALLACAAAAPAALAQAFPNRPVRVIVPFPTGGAADALARLVAQQMGKQMGQSFVVDNKQGAGGTIGNAEFAKAAPDGYTILLSSAPFVITQYVYPKLPYDGHKDFLPLGLLQTTPLVFVVNSQANIRSFADYMAAARAKPDQLTFGTSGNGSLIHLTGELLKLQAGINLTHVPYRGGGPALQDLLAGHVTSSFMSPIEVNPYLKSGQLIGLATTSAKRLPAYDLPTFNEAGVAGFESTAWFGFMARPGTPPEVIAALSENLRRAVHTPEVRDKIAQSGDVPAATQAEINELLVKEHARWSRAVKAANVKPE
jgi:tripartite-type tricarboxylate transporter receptor subunit TctC